MFKIINILMSFLVIFFVFKVFSFYSSNKNISFKNYNRSNIDLILKEKIKDLPSLANDTSNVIEFNSSFSEELKDAKPRNFWDLLKIE